MPARLVSVLLLLAFTLAGCAYELNDRAATPDELKIGELAQAVAALGPEVDPEEAARLAFVAVTHPRQLARDWNVTDPPLIHNAKVNMGLRPAGLCYQWADAMEARLRAEDFRTLKLHRAIANHDNYRIEHSTVIVSAPGQSMEEGIILDPWRFGGILHWSGTLEDPDYIWIAREKVFADKRERAYWQDRAAGG
jgi:hypothetical protein